MLEISFGLGARHVHSISQRKLSTLAIKCLTLEVTVLKIWLTLYVQDSQKYFIGLINLKKINKSIFYWRKEGNGTEQTRERRMSSLSLAKASLAHSRVVLPAGTPLWQLLAKRLKSREAHSIQGETTSSRATSDGLFNSTFLL